MCSSKSDEWPTSPADFARWNAVYNLNLDACASAENAKCARFFTAEDDGLSQRWTGRVWMNPPYGRGIDKWMKKAYESAKSGDAEIAVCLVPARTSSRWWHDWAMKGEIEYLKGRLTFDGQANPAPFGNALVVFRNVTKRANYGRAD
jgi:phage N-6-adenine-methyltransferase